MLIEREDRHSGAIIFEQDEDGKRIEKLEKDLVKLTERIIELEKEFKLFLDI